MSEKSIEDRIHEEFLREIAEHEMVVIADDGDVSRTLRFMKPNTYIYGFELVTWPGYLAISGDGGNFLFNRTRDMFEFFAGEPSGSINLHYWSEKLRAPDPRATRVFSLAKWVEAVEKWRDSTIAVHKMMSKDAEDFRAEVRASLIDTAPLTSHEAIAHAREFSFTLSQHTTAIREPGRAIRIEEPWEWDYTEWDTRFVWCCWAVQWGIETYRKEAPLPRPAKTPAQMLEEFHGSLKGAQPRSLRLTLHEEEHRELEEELRMLLDNLANPAERALLARELADVVYIAFGTAHVYGIDLDVALAEIHRAAMEKVNPTCPECKGFRIVGSQRGTQRPCERCGGSGRIDASIREDGKVMKPALFIEPDLSRAIK